MIFPVKLCGFVSSWQNKTRLNSYKLIMNIQKKKTEIHQSTLLLNYQTHLSGRKHNGN